jgi:hypothetical protein
MNASAIYHHLRNSPGDIGVSGDVFRDPIASRYGNHVPCQALGGSKSGLGDTEGSLGSLLCSSSKRQPEKNCQTLTRDTFPDRANSTAYKRSI